MQKIRDFEFILRRSLPGVSWSVCIMYTEIVTVKIFSQKSFN